MDKLRRWVAGQFTTRVIVLMPVAIAINIVLGYTVQSVLKLPIYLDSIGTILVGVLAGPLPAPLTGILTNLIWQYAPGIGSGSTRSGRSPITAGVIGLLAGLWGQLGLFRPRRGRRPEHGRRRRGGRRSIGALSLYTYARAYASPEQFASATLQGRGVLRPVAPLLPGRHGRLRRRSSAWALSCAATSGRSSPSAPASSPASSRPSSRPRSPPSSTAASPAAARTRIVAAFRAGGDSLYQADPQAGPAVRPDRQDDHDLRGLLHRRQPARAASSPGSRNGEKARRAETEPEAERADRPSPSASRPAAPRPQPRRRRRAACPTTSSAGRAASTAA